MVITCTEMSGTRWWQPRQTIVLLDGIMPVICLSEVDRPRQGHMEPYAGMGNRQSDRPKTPVSKW